MSETIAKEMEAREGIARIWPDRLPRVCPRAL